MANNRYYCEYLSDGIVFIWQLVGLLLFLISLKMYVNDLRSEVPESQEDYLFTKLSEDITDWLRYILINTEKTSNYLKRRGKSKYA